MAGRDEGLQGVEVGAVVGEGRAERIGARGCAEGGEGRGQVGGVDPASIDELRERYRTRQRMPLGQGYDEVFVRYGRRTELYGGGEVQGVCWCGYAVGGAQGERTGGCAGDNLRAAADRQGDLGAGVGSAYFGQKGDESRCRQRGGRQGKGGGWGADGSAYVGSGGVEAEEEWTGVFEQALAGRCRDHGTAAEERRTQIGLEGGDVLRDGRLRVAEVRGGGRERAAFGDSNEGPQQMRIHEYQYL